MIYRVIGIMSGSSLDGLDIVFTELEETGSKWKYAIKAAKCIPYNKEWQLRLQNAHELSAYDYLLLHCSYGKFIGKCINQFIEENSLEHQVQLIASHGHTVFHAPEFGMTAQLGDGAAIAATTQINVVTDLRNMDVAFGGQGAPIVPIGEKLFFSEYDLLLNLGGIANISYKTSEGYIAFDICPANRVLNMLANITGNSYDEDGKLSSSGKINTALLTQLNALEYYKKTFPKSLSNSFGVDEVFPLIQTNDINVTDKLRTYTEHIAMQTSYAVQALINKDEKKQRKLLVSGGGAFNKFLLNRISDALDPLQTSTVVAEPLLINYKEALIMALIGVLRWREEYNVLHTATGATRSSIGGAVWIGQEG